MPLCRAEQIVYRRFWMPCLELRGLEPLTSSMPWNGPPSVFSAWLQLALIARVRLLLGPISAEMRTYRLLSSVTTPRSSRGFGHVQPQLRATRSQRSIDSAREASLGASGEATEPVAVFLARSRGSKALLRELRDATLGRGPLVGHRTGSR